MKTMDQPMKQFPTETVAYTEGKTAFLEAHAEQWLNDHHEATDCAVWEGLARDANRLFTDIFNLDSRLQESYCEGVPYQQELEERIHKLVIRWSKLADTMLACGAEFERKGYAVECLPELRQNAVEAKAAIDPSFEPNEAIVKLRDQQIAEHHAGQSLEGFAG